MMNEGIIAQIRNRKINHVRPGNKIRLRDIALVSIYVIGYYRMPYNSNKVKTEEELDVEIKHYQFLRKYNLL
jgi:hypothetical protein